MCTEITPPGAVGTEEVLNGFVPGRLWSGVECGSVHTPPCRPQPAFCREGLQVSWSTRVICLFLEVVQVTWAGSQLVWQKTA